MKYSQNDEEQYILNYFKGKTGKFVDIGAYDVFRFSNTRALYELGWHGVLVEPAPKNYAAIADHYKYAIRMTVLNIAVGAVTGDVDFYESNGDAVGTTDAAHMEKWGAVGVQYEKIRVAQVGAAEFADQRLRGCDFLSIDTESTNFELFEAMPEWVWQEIKMLCIEHDGRHEEITASLAPYGFTERYTNAENIILAK